MCTLPVFLLLTYEETLWDDENGLHLDLGEGHMSIYVGEILWNCMLNTVYFL